MSSAQPTLAPNVVFVIYGKNLGRNDCRRRRTELPDHLSNTAVTYEHQWWPAINALMYYTLAGAVTACSRRPSQPGTYAAVYLQRANQRPAKCDRGRPPLRYRDGQNEGGTGVAQATIAK